MQTLYQILGLIGAGLVLYILYKTIQGRPEQFSKENFTKSFLTMGILTLILIGFIILLALLVRAT